MAKRILISFMFVLFLGLFSVNRLSAISEFDIAFTYVHPIVKNKPSGGFTIGGYEGIYEKLPVHFGIRVDFSINLVETTVESALLDSNVRLPLFIGLRVVYPISIISIYAELGPEASFDFDYVDRSRDPFDYEFISLPEFSFNFGGGFGFGFNIHLSSFLIGGIFRYHVHMDATRQYFSTGLVMGGRL